MRLWFRFYLWWNNVCPEHGAKKFGRSGHWCPECSGAKYDKTKAKIEKYRSALNPPAPFKDAGPSLEECKKKHAHPGPFPGVPCLCFMSGADGTRSHHGNTVLFRATGVNNQLIESCGNHAACYRQSAVWTEVAR